MKKLLAVILVVLVTLTTIVSTTVSAQDTKYLSPEIYAISGQLLPPGNDIIISGVNFLDFPETIGASQLQVWFIDPLTGGVNYLTANEVAHWDNLVISLKTPINLKANYMYQVRIYINGIVSNSYSYNTGSNPVILMQWTKSLFEPMQTCFGNVGNVPVYFSTIGINESWLTVEGKIGRLNPDEEVCLLVNYQTDFLPNGSYMTILKMEYGNNQDLGHSFEYSYSVRISGRNLLFLPLINK